MKKNAVFRWRQYLFYLYAVLLHVGLVFTHVQTAAQVSDKQVVFEAHGEALGTLITRLSKNSGVNIGYPSTEVKKYPTIHLVKGSRTVLQTLKELLKNTGLDCRPAGAILVVFKKDEPKPARDSALNVSGKVLDEQMQPLAGITATIEGTQRGTVTDNNGRFYFEQVEAGALVTVKGIGYPMQQLPATANMVFRLMRQISSLDEVQVIAYGTTTKRFNTGNVGTVTATEIASQPITNPLLALQGRVPGLVVSQTSGLAGGALKIQIRGQTSLDLDLSKNDPLIIIDGVPFEMGNTMANQLISAANASASTNGLSALNGINLSDIASIEVLKDADATAIYGSRGANGVILITTKKGKVGKTSVQLNTYSGWSSVARSMDMLNTQQYLSVRREAFANDGLEPNATAGTKGFAPDLMLWDTVRYTDFRNYLIGGTGRKTDVQLSVTGGNEGTQFYLGGGYHKETTVYPGDFSDLIASLHYNVSHTTKDRRLTLNFSGMYSQDRNRLPQQDFTRYIGLPPNLQLYDSSGAISWQEKGIPYTSLRSDFINPLLLLNQEYEANSENLSNNLLVSYKIFKELIFRTSAGFNIFSSDEVSRMPTTAIDPFQQSLGTLPYASFANQKLRSWIVEPQLDYKKNLGDGKATILIGSTFQDKTNRSSYMQGENYTSDLLLGSINGAGNIYASNDYSKYRYTAVFGRLNYIFRSRYILNLSARRDGSSRFAPERRWANFGAIGGAWIFSGEDFMRSNLPVLSFGKIRTSYGTVGNDQIGDYKYLNLWRNTNQTYMGIPGLLPVSLYNPDYNWERSKKFEAAVDIGLFDDNLLISLVYYRNTSSNQLINYQLPIQTGFQSIIRNFPGVVRNTGWEFVINGTILNSTSWRWTSNINFSLPKNKLVSFPGLSSSSYTTTYIVGKPVTAINGTRYLGVDPETGLYKLEDVNGDGVFNSKDYQYGGFLAPKFYGGWQNSISVKGVELTFLVEFKSQTGSSFVQQISNYAAGSIGNQPVIVLERWQKPGDISKIQRLTSSTTGRPANTAVGRLKNSSGAYTDASFARLKNVSASYMLPLNFSRLIGLNSIRLFTDAQNLLTFTRYRGPDPETQNFYVLPPLLTVVAGVKLTL